MSNPELERFKTICETIAILHPDMPMSEALPLALEVETRALTRMLPTTQGELVEMARRTPGVMSNLPHRKIYAIKELRQAFAELEERLHPGITAADRSPLGGLRQCKEAVEAVEVAFRPTT